MKKYFYIFLIMIGFLIKAQNPIYHFKFDNSLTETNNPAHSFTMYTNGVPDSPYYYSDRFGEASGSLVRIPNTTNFFVSSGYPNLQRITATLENRAGKNEFGQSTARPR